MKPSLEKITGQSAVYFTPKNSLRAREKDPWSRALSALPEDLTLNPNSHVYPEADS